MKLKPPTLEQRLAIRASGRDPEYYTVVSETVNGYIITDRMYHRDRIEIGRAPQSGSSYEAQE